MKKTILKNLSDKQSIEIALRRVLKWELYNEQEGKCNKCGVYITYYSETASNFPHLSHKKRLSDGGKTTRENCEVLCASCHTNGEHGRNNIYNEQPQWSK